jgi:DNA processing protein
MLSLTNTELCVALSVFRPAFDTRTARLFHELDLTARMARGEDAVHPLAEALGLLPSGVPALFAAAVTKARAATAAAQARRLTVLTPLDGRYPPQLGHIPDPPVALWVDGLADVCATPCVAIVGSRHATAGGLGMARTLGRELAAAGLTVVSGLARGIDGAAHQGALEGAGRTVAVLGSGVDVVYPREHESLAGRIRTAGAVISEFLPGTRPLAPHFPLRNRIISGLARAVVVIEASEKSGSLITARAALEQGRDVLAVPGNVAGGRYSGGHALIKDGARLVETVDDILDEIRWPRRPDAPATREGNSRLISKLLTLIGESSGVSLDELVSRSGRPAADVLAELSALEVAGTICRVAGGGFART